MSNQLKKYNLKKVINASGRMSILGVSTPSDSVMAAIKSGGQQYVEMKALDLQAGAYIAKTLQAEDAIVVNSASSGIVLSVAAMVTQGNIRKSAKLHQEKIETNEIIILKGHNVDYGSPIEVMIAQGGGKLIEAGYANAGTKAHITSSITDKTAAILYVKSHHTVQKNMLSVEETWQIAKAHDIPFIVDAAAEEDLLKYISISDLVIFSGSKALEGPTSGIVVGKQKYIDWLRIQQNYLGRSMKIGKEMIFGFLQAFDEYSLEKKTQTVDLTALEELNSIEGVRVIDMPDLAGRKIIRKRIYIDELILNQSAQDVANQLKHGDIAIYTRDHGLKQGFFEIDPRPIKQDDVNLMYQKIKDIVGDVNHESN